LDAYYLERPKELWHRAPEPAVVDPANVAILEQHLPCAAHEVPIDVRRDTPVFDDAALGRRLRETAAATATATTIAPYQTPYLLALKRALAPTRSPADLPAGERNGGWHDGTPLLVYNALEKRVMCRAGYRPHADVSLRGFPRDGRDWVVLDVTKGDGARLGGGAEVERVEPRDAMKRVYPGCLFSSRRGAFRVVGPLDFENRVAKCVRVSPAEARRRWTSPTVRVEVAPSRGAGPQTGRAPASLARRARRDPRRDRSRVRDGARRRLFPPPSEERAAGTSRTPCTPSPCFAASRTPRTRRGGVSRATRC
jgi:hypothetical protein